MGVKDLCLCCFDATFMGPHAKKNSLAIPLAGWARLKVCAGLIRVYLKSKLRTFLRLVVRIIFTVCYRSICRNGFAVSTKRLVDVDRLAGVQ